MKVVITFIISSLFFAVAGEVKAQAQVQFERTFYIAEEEPGNASLMLTRTGSSETVTVLYSVIPETAHFGTDYLVQGGSITIPLGQFRTRLDIPLRNDDVWDSSETFRVRLDQVIRGDGVIGNPDTATVWILDDDFRLIPGDVNHSCSVEFDDFLALSANFGQQVGRFGLSRGDINGDETVNLDDFLLLSANYGQACPRE